MPPKTKRQIATSLNYRKRKDREGTRVRDEARVRSESTSSKARVEGESTSGEARVEGELTSGEARVEGESMSSRVWVESESTSSEARVEGESTSIEARVEDKLTSREARVEGELTRIESTSSDGEEQDATVKRPRLEDISTLAAEPLQEWLDNLPRDDLRHVALLLYTSLPRKFDLQKTDTAATVGIQKQSLKNTTKLYHHRPTSLCSRCLSRITKHLRPLHAANQPTSPCPGVFPQIAQALVSAAQLLV